MTLSERLKKQGARPMQAKKGALWTGPDGEGEQGGITFSLLSRFLVCRERFRIHTIDGLRPADGFNHRLEYGSMWHVCEEAHAKGESFKPDLLAYCRKLCERYRTQQEQVQHWYEVCCVQFPVYVEFWKQHEDVKDRTPLLQEQVFDVPYKLPSRRVVRLRGKWDSVDIIGRGKAAGVYLQENKTKGDINEQQIVRQLSFDLQTMMYLTALETAQEQNELPLPLADIKGVRYNVIRRPLSGGKGTIKQKGGETARQYYDRLRDDYIAAEPSSYFFRWKCEVIPADIERFRRECLDPILMQLCWWWDWVGCGVASAPPAVCHHWRHPFGVWNILDEGGSSDLDNYLATGSTVGLVRSDDLFPELRPIS